MKLMPGIFVFLSLIITSSHAQENQAPTADPQRFELQTGQPVVFDLATDDPDGDELNYTVISEPQYGSIEGQFPHLTYTPDPGFNGIDILSYNATDGEFSTADTSVTFSVGLTYCEIRPVILEYAQLQDATSGDLFTEYRTAVRTGNYSFVNWNGENDAVTLADNLQHPENSHNYINPDDINDTTLDVDDWLQGTPGQNNSEDVNTALNGLINESIIVPLWSETRESGSNLDYHVAGFANIALTDFDLGNQSYISFIYQGVERCLNYAPVTYDNSFEAETETPHTFVLGAENTTIEGIPQLLAVFDQDNDELSYTIIELPQHGTLSGEGPEFIYTSNLDYEGEDSFDFMVNDGKADSNIATITINVIDPNVAPVAEDQTIITNEDQSLNITLMATDANGDELSYQLASQPTNGTLSGVAPDLTYTPNPDYNGTDEFNFIANDGQLDSQTATVSITINPVNDAPVISDISISINEDQSGFIQFTGEDIDGDNLTYMVVSEPANGIFTNGIYTPNPDFNGSDSFTYVANDGTINSESATITITINSVNDAPVATSFELVTAEDATKNITLSGTDIEGDALTYQITSQPTNGTLSGTAPDLTYTPDENYFGTDTFAYLVNDGTEDSQVATVSLTMTPVNDQPIATELTLTTEYQTTIEVPFSATDVEDTELTYQIDTYPQSGTLTETSGSYSYQPNSGFSGQDIFSYTATDTEGLTSAPASVTITVEENNNEPPIIVSTPQLYSTTGSMYQYSTVVVDPDNDVLDFSLSNAPTGAVMDSATGVIEWMVTNDYSPGITESNIMCYQQTNTATDGNGAEFIFMVDGSQSLDDQHKFIPTWLPLLGGELLNQGVGDGSHNQFGLSVFLETAYPVVFENGSLFTSIETIIENMVPSTKLRRGGTNENLITSLNEVLDNYTLSADKNSSIIFITDEACEDCPDNPQETDSVIERLLEQNIVLHGIVDDTWYGEDFIIQCGNGQRALGMSTDGTGYYAADTGYFESCENAMFAKISNTVLEHYIKPIFATGGSVWDLKFIESEYLIQNALSEAMATVMARSTASQTSNIGLADLYFSSVDADTDIGQLTVSIANRGLQTSEAASLNVLSNDTQTDSIQIPGLAPGESFELMINKTKEALNSLSLEIVSSNSDNECDIGNNKIQTAYFDWQVSDPESLSDDQNYVVSVNEQNQSPVITSYPKTGAQTGIPYTAYVVAEDTNKGDALRYELVSGGHLASINALTGEFSWLPAASSAPDVTFTVSVTDLTGTSDQVSFTLPVEILADRFNIISRPIRSVLPGAEYEYMIETNALSSAILEYSLLAGPSGMIINTAGIIAWSAPVDVTDQFYVVVVQVTDQYGNSDVQSYLLTVENDPPSAPFFQIDNPSQVVGEGGLYETTGSVIDVNALEIFDFKFLRKPDAMSFNDDLIWGQPPADYQSRYDFLLKWYDASTTDLESLKYTNHWVESDTANLTDLGARLERTINLGFEMNSKFAPNLLVTSLKDSNQNGKFDSLDDKSLIYADANGIRAVSGKDFSEQWYYSNLLVPDVPSTVGRNNTLAVADLDGDFSKEVIVLDNDGYLNILSSDGILIRTTDSPISTGLFRTSVKAMDLDADGSMELLVANRVYNMDGSLRFEMTVPYWPFDTHYEATALDVDQDGLYEVLYDTVMYNQDGSIRISNIQPGGYFAPLNADEDVQLEWFQVSRPNGLKIGTLYDNDGTELWSKYIQNYTKPTIADIDYDGMVEIILGYEAYELNGDVIPGTVGRNEIQLNSFLADVNGDGAFELVLESLKTLRLYDPITKGLIWIWNKPTGQNQSIVADIDSDGSTEILYAYADSGILKLDILGASEGRWTGVVSEVNQSRDNAWVINPVTNQSQLIYNVYSDQLFENHIKPDLHATGPQITGQTGAYQLFAEVSNLTPSLYQGRVQVEFYNNEILPENLLGVSEITDLGMNAKKTAILDRFFELDELSDTLVAKVIALDDEDINPDNNSASSELVSMMATDLTGLTGESTYTLRVSEFNYVPLVPYSYSLPAATVSQLYEQTVPVQNGPGHFMLYEAPQGLSLNSKGIIRWAPGPDQLGQHEIKYVLFDPARPSINLNNSLRSLPIQVNSGDNLPPIFNSSSYEMITVGDSLNLQISATDPEGTAVRYELISAPQTATLDASAILGWTSAINDMGLNKITLRAIDADNGFTDQILTVLVINDNNTAPVITSTPGGLAGLNRIYSYPLTAVDDSEYLSYSLIDSPSGMTISGQGLVEWTPDSSGIYQVTVEVSDGEFSIQQQWDIEVLNAGGDINGSIFLSFDELTVGGVQDIQVIPSGTVGNVNVTATLNGTPLTLDNQFATSVTVTSEGTKTIQAVISDDLGSINVQRDFEVLAYVDVAPEIDILSPADADVITGFADLQIHVQDDNLQSWRLSYRRGLADPSQDINSLPRTILVEGNDNVNNSVVAELDTSLMKNGIYVLILEAMDTSGQASSVTHSFFLEGDLKLGHFSIAFEDMNVPVAGIPVSISRSYDTRDRNEDKDFGKGWSIGHQALELQESRIPGQGWYMSTEFYFIGPIRLPRYCIEPIGDRLISVRMPDGKLDKFKVKARVLNPSDSGRSQCQDITPPEAFAMDFEPQGDTTSTLKAESDELDYVVRGGNVEPLADLGMYDPNKYTLTLLDGTVYSINQGFNLTQIETTSGHSLKFTHDGIEHANGFAVQYIRDAQDRIQYIEKPNGERLGYTYDTEGNLASFTDLQGNTTTFSYVADHYLEDIHDPRGIRVARNEYDADGRLIAHIDADGKRIEYTHDIAGRIEIVKDRNGDSSTYIYDNAGNVVAQTNPMGETTYHEYNELRLETARIDPLGNRTEWSYDHMGNQLTETDALGNTTSNLYDNKGRLLTKIDALGNTVVSSEYNSDDVYDGRGQIKSMTDANGNKTEFNWISGVTSLSPSGRSVSVNTGFTNPFGDIFTTTALTNGVDTGLEGSTIELNGLKTETTYTDSGLLPLTKKQILTDLNGNAISELLTTYEYDSNNNLIKVIDPLGNISRTEYNEIGKVSAVIDANNSRIENTYDNLGNLVKVTYPDGSTEHSLFDANGNQISSTNRVGHVTKTVYDPANRPVRTILPDNTPNDDNDNPTIINTYDARGKIISVTDALGNITSYEYDAVGRKTKIIDALGNQTTSVYNEIGRKVQSIDALGRVTKFEYNNAGLVTKTILPDDTPNDDSDNLFSTNVYDELLRKISETDLSGHTTHYEYNKSSQLTAVIDTLGQRTEYSYDQLGNKLTQTDANNNTTTWTYDKLSRITSRTLPEGQTEYFTYDAVGNMLTKTDFNGETTSYEYNSLNQQIKITYPYGTFVKMTYSPSGQVESVVQTQGITTYQYDERDNLIRIDYPTGNFIAYDYDLNDNRIQLRTANQVVDYSFDVLNRLSAVSDANGITSYMYDEVGNKIAQINTNNTVTYYEYNALNQLANLTYVDANDTVIAAYSYNFDANGNRTQISELSGRAIDYTYDNLNRLTSERITDAINGSHYTEFEYDAVGNLLQQVKDNVSTAYVYNKNDQLLSETSNISVISYSYDDNGNTVSKSVDGNLEAEYFYNFDNRLIQAVTPTDSIAYLYDINGIRQAEAVNGVTTNFLVDPNRSYDQVLEELDEFNNPLVIYSYGDDLISQTKAGLTNTFGYDGLGSTRFLTDSFGSIENEYGYLAYGEIDYQLETVENDYLFTGEQYDSNIGLYYLRNRFYNQSNTRFVSMDTFAGFAREPLSLNKYLYTTSNPINYTDPSGFAATGTAQETQIAGGVGATIMGYGTTGYVNVTLIAANDALWVTTGTLVSSVTKAGLGILTGLALTADSRGRDRLTGVPIIVFGGNQFPGHAEHILDAQTGFGSNGIPITFALNRTPSWPRTWLGATQECSAKARLEIGGDVACDEYPFATTRQGGQLNRLLYNSVSLRFLDGAESRKTAGFISTFYSRAIVSPDGITHTSRFLVLGIPNVDSFYTDRNGIVHRDGWR